MIPSFNVYFNGYYFSRLEDSSTFTDRPEPYRSQERELWTIYQIMKTGHHRISIVNDVDLSAVHFGSSDDLKSWIESTYPDLSHHLEDKIYTRYPHPQSYFSSKD